MRVSSPRTLLLLAIVLALPPAAGAQPNLTGTWTMACSVSLPDVQGTCDFTGQASITHNGSSIFGLVDLDLVSGPPGCPAEMLADLTGTVMVGNGSQAVVGTLNGQLGSASFTGTISPNPGGEGSVTTEQGPFTGSTGSWSAQLLGITAIPTLTPLGLTLLVGLLLLAGALALRRRDVTRRPA